MLKIKEDSMKKNAVLEHWMNKVVLKTTDVENI